MRTRDLTQEKLKWNKPLYDLYKQVPASAPASTPSEPVEQSQ